jgi:hypothetical protein
MFLPEALLRAKLNSCVYALVGEERRIKAKSNKESEGKEGKSSLHHETLCFSGFLLSALLQMVAEACLILRHKTNIPLGGRGHSRGRVAHHGVIHISQRARRTGRKDVLHRVTNYQHDYRKQEKECQVKRKQSFLTSTAGHMGDEHRDPCFKPKEFNKKGSLKRPQDHRDMGY